ncbi:MAG: extracellular solute-binding protein [Clostridiaceae bacterium]|nr:extracellular solute-binding protein [Clostridiaceae bacterium]
MRALRRLTSLALSLAFVGMTLAACNTPGTSQATTTAGGATTKAEATTTKGEDPTTQAGTTDGEEKAIELWHIQNTEPMPTIIQGSVDRYMADNPNVKVTVNFMANDSYKQKIAVALTSGTVPDIFLSWGGGPMNEYVDAGKIVDMTSYMAKDNYQDIFMTAALAQATYNDKIYGFPLENVATANFFYNKDVFAANNIEVPTTLAELEAAADTLKAAGVIPFSLANKTQWTGSMYFMYLATRDGGTAPFKDALAGTSSFENESFVYAGNKIQEWVDKGYFNDGFNGADEDSGQSRQLLYTGDAAMTLMGSWFLYTVKGENPDFYDNVGSFMFPGIEGKADPNIVVGTMGDNLYHISSTSKHPEEAFEVLKYMLDETSIEERVAASKIPPIKGLKYEDPLMQKIIDDVEKAADVQLWYDQSLPPEVAEVHKTTSQEIFGKTMTPEDANKALQEAMQAYIDNK